MTSPCVIGCGSVHAAALPTNGTGMPQRIFIRKRRLPVSEVAVRPVYGLPPSEFRIPQGFARGSTSSGFLIERGLQGMHGALEVSTSAEVFDELRHRTHASEGGNLQQTRVSETSDHAVVLIFVQQGFEHGTGLRAVLGEHIALAHIGHAVAVAGRRRCGI